jgi:hypothetical protein
VPERNGWERYAEPVTSVTEKLKAIAIFTRGTGAGILLVM